jgi:uncharacterized protein YdaU (DUF1376 family)
MSGARKIANAVLGDTQHLSQAEFGAYMLMLIELVLVGWTGWQRC